MKELERCPACGSEDIASLYTTRRDLHGQTWHLSQCLACAHGFVNPQPDWEELEPYYPEAYGNYSPEHNLLLSSDEVIEQARETGILRHAPISEGTRVLDVGCGGGGFLSTAAKLGATVKGVELSKYAAKQTREQGIEVFCGTVEAYEQSQSGEKFDVITMSHVLEHVPEPLKAMEAMRGLLADNGVVVLALPNGAYWAWKVLREEWPGMDVPRHLMHFSQESLARCSERAGFAVESIGTQCEPHAVASTLRRLLRSRLFVPLRVSTHFKFIDHSLACSLGKKWDAKDKGEALVAHLKVGSPAPIVGARRG